MDHLLSKHNERATVAGWWRKYFWAQDEYWAKYAAYRAAQKAKVAMLNGDRDYYFWDQVCRRAAAYCEDNFGEVPELITRRPIERSNWAFSSPAVSRWLASTQPPYRRRANAADA